jgi:hypothetical protein
MSWNTLATTDVTNQMTAGEIAALQNIQGADTELQGILTRVVNQARSQIKAGGNQVDQTGVTVPDSVAQDCIDIARWKWLSSFPALKAFKTEEREKAHDSAQKHLSGIASQNPNRERVELPANADTTPVAVPMPSVGCPKRVQREDGIV